MDKERIGYWSVIIVMVIALILLSLAIISLVWGWIVPDLFAGAVEKGILPASITLWQAFKLMVLFSLLKGIFEITIHKS